MNTIQVNYNMIKQAMKIPKQNPQQLEKDKQ